MKKVLYILDSYPQLSESYVHVEIDALVEKGFDVSIVAPRKANRPALKHLPYKIISDEKEIIEYAKEYQPDIIHTHWIFYLLPLVYKVSKALDVGFTIRSHSFDVLWKENSLKQKIRRFIKNVNFTKIINDPLCKGVLAFPFAKKILIDSGIKEEKIVEVVPVVDFEKFHDEGDNGTDILNMGAAIEKKGFKNFIYLAKKLPDLKFKLYTMGYNKKEYENLNRKLGMPVSFEEPVEFDEMPAVYKRSAWLVYTVSKKNAQVGWPLCALEAMASGTGVCLPNIRPDIRDYIGDAGIIYSDIEELKDIITKPVSQQMREKGFELARKYDIRKQIHLLTNLWK
jgi:glycosyltransferase involved in cell wall biosynthesis